MGLPKIIQIPCHHVLANQNALKLKKGALLKQFFNINLGIGIIKKTTFLLYFRHISMCFYSNLDQDISLDVELNSASNEYPLDILFMGPLPKKQEIPENVMMTSSSHFSGISFFWGSWVRQKYALWVLVGCGIKFRIQRALPIEI